jgi:hypothetical protein
MFILGLIEADPLVCIHVAVKHMQVSVLAMAMAAAAAHL